MKGFIACLQCVRLGADCLTDVSTLSHIAAFVDSDVKLDLHQVTCFVFTATEKLYVSPLVSALRDSEEKTRKWRVKERASQNRSGKRHRSDPNLRSHGHVHHPLCHSSSSY